MEESYPIGIQTCEERKYTGGDADDVWFCYHTSCYESFLQQMKLRSQEEQWKIEAYHTLLFREAKEEEYICDYCEKPLANELGK